MGLDQYLYRANRTNHSVEQLAEIHLGGYSIFHQVGYWRKANQIHNWFVQNVQNGVDECQLVEVTREDLEKLKLIVQNSLEHRNADLLPTISGFFFGSTAIDDYYWQDLEQTLGILNTCLNMDWEKNRFFYRASW